MRNLFPTDFAETVLFGDIFGANGIIAIKGFIYFRSPRETDVGWINNSRIVLGRLEIDFFLLIVQI